MGLILTQGGRIDQLAQFMGVKAAEIFSAAPIPSELADLLEQFSLGLALLLVLAFLASRQQLTATIQQLLLPLIHLNRVDDVIGDDLWIVLRPLIVALATDLNSGRWAGAPISGRYPPQRLTMGPVRKNKTSSLHD